MERAFSVPILATLLGVHVFVLDLVLSFGGVGAFLYVVVVLVAGWLPSKSLLLGTATTSSLLAISGFCVLHPQSTGWMALDERGVSLVAIWTTAAALRYLHGPLLRPHLALPPACDHGPELTSMP